MSARPPRSSPPSPSSPPRSSSRSSTAAGRRRRRRAARVRADPRRRRGGPRLGRRRRGRRRPPRRRGPRATGSLEAPETCSLVDVRPPTSSPPSTCPGSRNLDLPCASSGPRAPRSSTRTATRTVVLVSNGMTHPAQAWVELARRGRTNVRVLEEGLDGCARRSSRRPRCAAPRPSAAADERPSSAPALAKVLLRAPPRRPARAEGPLRDRSRDARGADRREDGLGRRPPRHASCSSTPREAEAYGRAGPPPGRGPRAHRGPPEHAGHRGPTSCCRPTELAAKAGRLGHRRRTPRSWSTPADRLQDATHLALALVALGHRTDGRPRGRVRRLDARGARGHDDRADADPDDLRPARPAPTASRSALDAVNAASRARRGPRILDVRPAEAFDGEAGHGGPRRGTSRLAQPPLHEDVARRGRRRLLERRRTSSSRLRRAWA